MADIPPPRFVLKPGGGLAGVMRTWVVRTLWPGALYGVDPWDHLRLRDSA